MSYGARKSSDRWLVGGAFLLLLFSVAAFYFDSWMQASTRDRGQVIGEISGSDGDVRVKFAEDIAWQKTHQGQPLHYNDAIYSGSNSQAHLKLGSSQLVVQENSMVVLRREKQIPFLNLSYGSFIGMFAKEDNIQLYTDSGKLVTLRTTNGTKLKLKKVGNTLNVRVIEGLAHVESEGRVQTLAANVDTPVGVPPAPPPPPAERTHRIQLLSSSPQHTYYIGQPQELHFAWDYDGPVLDETEFKVELSRAPEFLSAVTAIPVRGQNTKALRASQNDSFYYRVRGPKNELSEVRQFSIVYMKPPQILSISEPGPVLPKTLAEVQFAADNPGDLLQLQIDRRPGFTKPLVNREQVLRQWQERLPPGRYYVRLRSRYAENQWSDWSTPKNFAIEALVPPPLLQVTEEPPPLEDVPPLALQEEPEAPERQPSTVNSSALQIEAPPFIYPPPYNYWAWYGAGYNFVEYNQSYSNRGSINGNGNSGKYGQFAEAGFIGNNGFGAITSYTKSPGEIHLQSRGTLDKSTYDWTTFTAEGIWLKGYSIFGRIVKFGPRLGVQYHSLPYLFLNQQGDLELKTNRMTMASVGPMAELSLGRWRFHSYLRYQYPLHSDASGAGELKVNSKIAFDGLVGTSFYLTPRLRTGLFWYGQWLDRNIMYSDGTSENSGGQSLFYSLMDLRMGLEF